MVGPAAASPFAERPTSSSKPAVVVVCIRHLSISFLGYPSAVVQLTASLTTVWTPAHTHSLPLLSPLLCSDSLVPLLQVDLSHNRLCGVWIERGTMKGTYTAEGIKAVANALRVSASLTSVRWPSAHEPMPCLHSALACSIRLARC